MKEKLMHEFKNEKPKSHISPHTSHNSGITLVALIITVIILLILAVVAIRAVQGDGIISHAKNAQSDYQVAQVNEEAILGDYLLKLERSAIQIGDKVNYDEGAGKISTIDSAFVMDDMEWRVLDVESDGTVELISTQPTTSKLTLSGESGWLSAEENLDKLCNDLYANGTGVTARSLKVEDINKLAGGLTDADKQELNSDYGIMWRYKYDPTAAKIQYSKSMDNGANWTNYVDGAVVKFKEPGKAEINSSNYQDAEGNPIVSEQKYIVYHYIISSKVTQNTSDGISIASLISQGLNDANDEESGTDVTQWLSTRGTYCDHRRTGFSVWTVLNDRMDNVAAFDSRGNVSSPTYAVRPVVTIPSTAKLTKVDGVWQIEL